MSGIPANLIVDTKLMNLVLFCEKLYKIFKIEQMSVTLYFMHRAGGPRVVVSTAAFHARVRFPVSAV